MARSDGSETAQDSVSPFPAALSSRDPQAAFVAALSSAARRSECEGWRRAGQRRREVGLVMNTVAWWLDGAGLFADWLRVNVWDIVDVDVLGWPVVRIQRMIRSDVVLGVVAL